MSDEKPIVGSIVWTDLTVPDAKAVRDFYAGVIGWRSAEHDMGEYVDYEIQNAEGGTVGGICYARGMNERVPPVWLNYIRVESVEESARRCITLGGEVVDGPRVMGRVPFCVIRDPAGACLALVGHPEEAPEG
jgi:predicted enzyme related to lactoylglutathione lyase